MRIVVTGADGFLGWHTRCRLHATTDHEVVPVGRAEWADLTALVAGADAVLHLAGINRAPDDELVAGNRGLAEDVAAAIAAAPRPLRLAFANSTQVGNGTAYADGKEQAAAVLRAAAERTGSSFVDVLLPNLFGEHGRPGYNSFVASFVDATVAGASPSISDRTIGLLHVQRAAAAMIAAIEETAPGTVGQVSPEPVATSVQQVWDTLQRFHTTYATTGDVPDLSGPLDTDLFNTYRAALFPAGYPIALAPRADQRGRLVETVRSHGAGGQTFVSTTVPGVTRGEHYHLHKIERFVVLSGRATIALRRLFTREVVELEVTGDEPVLVDMPTMWVHNITNTGDTELLTVFWTDTLFDADNPDTHPVPVAGAAELEQTR
ncbi:capsule biosynthesis protein CapF [Nocardioides sp. MAH-18]|uniref:Capsule biosynthesis protein CapF n=1 Tax=Nocardioides agri TaxID=2682843 RepID=A0A6L6XSG2_9ACTN|nr:MULTISPECIES: NAD-dependent epimerase/dehydratase family protein [unclassified Nocardioides]MBA2954888.1 capsule biosynthesis protein CapF [Nocardioides sp. CGMCC 1.13656]MVQ49742.1 capsule biosynthesis protein CapF [Nocardioides sp. MAH-18]